LKSDWEYNMDFYLQLVKLLKYHQKHVLILDNRRFT